MSTPTDTRPKLLLMPGMDGTDLLFESLREAIPETVDVHVASYPLSTDLGYPQLLDRLSAQLQQIGPCTLLAWSFSGPLAVGLEARHPELVRGLVFVASFVRCPLPWFAPVRRLVRAPVFTGIRALRRIPLRLRHTPADRYRQIKAELWQRVSGRLLAFRARQALAIDLRGEFKTSRAPALYFVSARDHIVPRHNFKEMLALKPTMEVAELEGDHFALYFQAAKAVPRILQFIKGAEAPSGSQCRRL